MQQLAAELRTIEEALPAAPPGAALDALLTRYDTLVEAMNQCDGWAYEHRIATVLSQLGFREQDCTRPIDQLSGGWRNRAALAKILLEARDVLLLDEPTNFLDLAGLSWLEQWLVTWRGTLVIVSHDRHFLDQVVNRIVEIENYDFQEYEGNFTQYIRKKQIRLKTLERQFQTSTQVMERALLHFPGAVVFVSHDRFFMDKVATRLLLFNGAGRTTFFEGNWTLWQANIAESKA